MREFQELLEPLRLGLPILFHVFPTLRPADHSAQGNDENIEQPVPGVRTPGITHVCERVKQSSGSRFFHGHAFSKVRVNRPGDHGYLGKGVCSSLKCTYPATGVWTLALAADVCYAQGVTERLVSDETIRRALKRLETN